jgi:hypothetical protein
MTRRTKVDGGIQQALRDVAMRYEGAEEGIACKGTAVESSAFKARKKTFLFVNAVHVRLKLRESLAEATALATKDPRRYEVGSLGWIKVTLGPEPAPLLALLERWIDESYRVVVGRAATPAAKKSTKRTTGSRN